MKSPANCENISEIRDAIDRIDKEIIRLLGERYSYVREVVRFKEPTEESIVAKDRFEAVISSRKKLAEESGLDPAIIEKIYTDLLNYFIAEELKLIRGK